MKLARRTFRRDDYYITSPYGSRESIKTKNGTTGHFHNGTDYGTHGEPYPQFALEDGTVTFSGRAADGAEYVKIKYPRIGYELMYYHLAKRCVQKGDKVDEATVIGTTGMTGRATGVHLHLTVRDIATGRTVDPETVAYQPPSKQPTPAPKTIKATRPAQSFSLGRTHGYTTSAALNIRDGAGTEFRSLGVLPRGTRVSCYGYYTQNKRGEIWLYVRGESRGITYLGFCSSRYLRR